jgi:hypothetical protein
VGENKREGKKEANGCEILFFYDLDRSPETYADRRHEMHETNRAKQAPARTHAECETNKEQKPQKNKKIKNKEASGPNLAQ